MLRWFLADLRTGRQILDLNVLSGQWERFVNAPERVSCTLDLRDPDTIALRLRVAAAVGRAVLAVATDDVVLAAGPVWAHRYDRDQKTLELSARGLWSYYDHRFVLPVLAASVGVTEFTVPDNTAAGKTKPNPALGTYLTGFELGTIAKKLVQQAHTWTGGSVPVVFEADRAGTHERNFEGAEFKNLGQVLKQLTEVEGGPDIRFRPRLTADRLGIEWVLETGTQAAPLLASNSVHQWDASVPESTVSEFEITVDGSNLAGTAWATGGRSGDEVLVARARDAWLTDHGWPLFEDLDSSHSSVSVQSTLDAYAAENTAAGRGAVEEWAFTVEANTTPRLGEFLEGDWCDVTTADYKALPGREPELLRRNSATYPNAEIGATTGWNSRGAGTNLSTTTAQAHSGTRSYQVITTGGAGIQGCNQSPSLGVESTGMTADTLSAWVLAPAGADMRFIIEEYSAANAFVGNLGTQTFTGTGAWQRVSRTVTKSLGVNKSRMIVTTGAAQAITFYVDDAMIEGGTVVGDSFDGNTKPAPGTRTAYQWDGPVNASTSSMWQTFPDGEIIGDPYLFEGGTHRRRITGISGDEKGLTVKVTTAPEVI